MIFLEHANTIIFLFAVIFIMGLIIMMAYGFTREKFERNQITTGQPAKTVLKILAVPCFLLAAWLKFDHAQEFRKQTQEDPNILDVSELWIIFPAPVIAVLLVLYLYRRVAKARGWNW